MVASKSHLVLAQVANPMGSMMIRVRLTNHDRQTISEAYSFTRTGAAVDARLLQLGWGRGGRRRSGAGHQDRSATRRQPPRMGLWIKAIYSVISVCHAFSSDKNVAPARARGGRYAWFCQAKLEEAGRPRPTRQTGANSAPPHKWGSGSVWART